MTKAQGRAFCTYFDHRYLARGLALIDSLRVHGCRDEIWVVCLTEICAEILRSIKSPGVHVLRITDLEDFCPALRPLRDERSAAEFYFTCTPLLVQFVFARCADVEVVSYLDADMYFFEPPAAVFKEIGDAPAAIIPHNYPRRLRKMERYGTYNVGWVSFDRSTEGQRLLDWWAKRCLEWCHDWVDEANDRFADQRYLQRFHTVAPGTRILRNKGFNLAPWNIANYQMSVQNGRVFADEDTLVFFHFHGVKKGLQGRYFNAHRVFHAPFDALIRERIYRPYVDKIAAFERQIAAISTEEKPPALARGGLARFHPKSLALRALRLLDLVLGRAIAPADPKAER